MGAAARPRWSEARYLGLLVAVALVLSLLGGASGTSAAGTYVALEIFQAGEPLEVPTPGYPNPQSDTTAVPEGLPAGTIGLFVVSGVVTAKNTDTASGWTEWQVGSQPVYLYASKDTRLDKKPAVGSLVKAICLRTLAAGPIVCERITHKGAGALPAGPAEIEQAFLYSGLVTAAEPTLWTIGGVDFVVNSGTDIDGGLGLGKTVVVEF
ncbi:MAG: hypothetical protein HY331_06100, partial [Chloroflexi bacterium]|nr:hypothetical protein [Chloroflexota bacterium]